jgi:catechol 2,3-dioxygenase-like lactoylglutathione lyase family enzyme
MRETRRSPRGLGVSGVYVCGVYLEHVAIVVDDYGPAIEFFVDVLGFELVEDSPAMTTDGRPKRWVVVRPPGAQTGILLARADGEHQVSAVGRQFAGRVGLFLRVADFEAVYQRMRARGVDFVSEPHTEPYGRVGCLPRHRRESLGPAGFDLRHANTPARRVESA